MSEELVTFTQDLVASLASMSSAETGELIALFEYQGFDPLKTLKALKKIEPNAKTLKTDLISLCTVLALRGTNTTKILEKTGDAGRAKLSALVSKYKIKVGGSRLSAEIITLGRIGATFPYFVASASNTYEIPPKSPMFNLTMGPSAFFQPQCASLFPKEGHEMHVPLMDAYSCVTLVFTAIVKPKATAEDYSESLRFMTIQNNSPIGSDEERLKWLLDLKILSKSKGRYTLEVDSEAIKGVCSAMVPGWDKMI